MARPDTPRPTDTLSLLQRLEIDAIARVWVVYHDYLGRAGGKIIPIESFAHAAEAGVVFATANLDFDHRDRQDPAARFLASDGDFHAVPDPRSYGVLPQFPGTARVNAFMRTNTGAPWDGCPRTRLEEMVRTARETGFSFQFGLEPEFYFVTRDEHGNRGPADTTAMYSAAGLATQEPILRRILDLLRGMGVAVPQVGREYGHGQYELSTRHSDPVTAVDNYYAVREAVRDAATEFGVEATFMPKPFTDWLGNSLHVHFSIWNAEGTTDLTPSDTDDTTLSPFGRHVVGGILAHIDALTGLGSPSVNSYKRLQPGTWAPGNPYWGYNNRSGVIRIPGPASRRHIEYRASDNTAQAEMLLTGLIAAALHGIRDELDPGAPFDGDVGHMSPDEIAAAGLGELRGSSPAALDALERDEVIGEALGETTLAHFLSLHRFEAAQYQFQVHEWEREYYFEIC